MTIPNLLKSANLVGIKTTSTIQIYLHVLNKVVIARTHNLSSKKFQTANAIIKE